MSSIPLVMTIGHELNEMLLIEAEAALGDGDWPYAAQRLRQFSHRVVFRMRTEEALLYPLYLRRAGVGSPTLRRLWRTHGQIEALATEAVDAASAADAGISFRAIAALMALVNRHWQDEQAMVRALPRYGRERLLREFSQTLGRYPCLFEAPRMQSQGPIPGLRH